MGYASQAYELLQPAMVQIASDATVSVIDLYQHCRLSLAAAKATKDKVCWEGGWGGRRCFIGNFSPRKSTISRANTCENCWRDQHLQMRTTIRGICSS